MSPNSGTHSSGQMSIDSSLFRTELRTDPISRCAALSLPRHALAILPFYQSQAELEVMDQDQSQAKLVCARMFLSIITHNLVTGMFRTLQVSSLISPHRWIKISGTSLTLRSFQVLTIRRSPSSFRHNKHGRGTFSLIYSLSYLI